MRSFALTPDFDPFKDCASRLGASREFLLLDKFFLECRPKTFHHRVVVAVGSLSHRRLMLCGMPCRSKMDFPTFSGHAPSVEIKLAGIECPRNRGRLTTRVLRVNEFFKNIKMRRFDACAEPISHASWKLSDFGNDPLQQIASQDDGGWFGGVARWMWKSVVAQSIEKHRNFFAQWMLSYVRRFTADSLHSQQRFDFFPEGLLLLIGLRFSSVAGKCQAH